MDARTYVELALRTEASDKDLLSTKIINNVILFMDLCGLNMSKTISGRFIKQRNIRLSHFAIGLMTEIAEVIEFSEKDKLDFINLSEEFGDANWYYSIAIDELKLDPEILNSKSLKKIIENCDIRKEIQASSLLLAKESGIILDHLKKTLFYGKDVDKNFVNNKIIILVSEMEYMARCGGFDIVKTRKINIDKLAKRYFEKFSEYNANNRKLDEERLILDKIIEK